MRVELQQWEGDDRLAMILPETSKVLIKVIQQMNTNILIFLVSDIWGG